MSGAARCPTGRVIQWRAPSVGAWLRGLLALLLLALGAGPCLAHKASDAYLLLAPAAGAANPPASPPAANANAAGHPAVRAELSIALKDLDAALPTLDADNDRALTWGEVRLALPQIIGWVENGFALQCAGRPLTLRFVFAAVEQRVDGHYVRLTAPLDCPAPAALVLDYALFEGIDASHRLLVGGALDGRPIAATTAPRAGRSLTLRAAAESPQAATATAEQLAPQSGTATLAQFFPEGVHHILSGIDHLAFLLALLLPIRLFRRRPTHATALDAARPLSKGDGVVALLRTVTAFTIGHSLTLGLASIGWIVVPPNWVEPAIAITIGISAALNLYPVRWIRTDVLALLFGLVHGLGFSEVMREAGIRRRAAAVGAGRLQFWRRSRPAARGARLVCAAVVAGAVVVVWPSAGARWVVGADRAGGLLDDSAHGVGLRCAGQRVRPTSGFGTEYAPDPGGI